MTVVPTNKRNSGVCYTQDYVNKPSCDQTWSLNNQFINSCESNEVLSSSHVNSNTIGRDLISKPLLPNLMTMSNVYDLNNEGRSKGLENKDNLDKKSMNDGFTLNSTNYPMFPKKTNNVKNEISTEGARQDMQTSNWMLLVSR